MRRVTLVYLIGNERSRLNRRHSWHRCETTLRSNFTEYLWQTFEIKLEGFIEMSPAEARHMLNSFLMCRGIGGHLVARFGTSDEWIKVDSQAGTLVRRATIEKEEDGHRS